MTPLTLAALAVLVLSGGLLLLALRRLGFVAAAPWAALLTVGASPLPYEAVTEPLAGHVLLFLAGALVLLAWAAGRERAARRAGLAGLLAGGVLVVLEQAADLARQAASGAAPHLALGAAARPHLLDALFSSRQGLVFWTPVAALGLAGLLPLARRDGATARLVAAAFAVVALASAFSWPWWSGRLGNGRFAGALPLVAAGLAALLETLRQAAARHPLRVLWAATLMAVLWNLLLMEQYRREMIPRDDTVSFAAVAENEARLVGRAVGSPVTWPASWIFSLRTGLPAERYDLAAGRDLFQGPNALRGVIDVGDLETDAALLLDGWSVRHACGPEVCREVEGRARVLAPLDRPALLDLRVRAMGTGTLTVALNGRPVAEGALGPAFADVGVRLARRRWRQGFNEVTLAVSPGGQALVDRLLFSPAARQP